MNTINNQYEDITKDFIDNEVIQSIKGLGYGSAESGTKDRLDYIIKEYGDYIEKVLRRRLVIISKDYKRGTGKKSFFITTNKQLERNITNCNGENLNMYEVILDRPCKLFFDIEYKEEMGKDAIYEFIKEVKIIFKKSFDEELSTPLITSNFNREGDMVIKNGLNGNEYSYHLIFYSERRFENNSKYLNYWITNYLMKELSDKFKNGFVDNSVYSKVRSFRLINQSKIGKENQVSRMINGDIIDLIKDNHKLLTNEYKYDSELFLIQELHNKKIGFYPVSYEEQSEEDRVLNGDVKVLCEVLTLKKKKSKKVIHIRNIEDIIMNIPNTDQSSTIKILIASFCKKRGLEDLYVKWNGDNTYYNDLCNEDNLYSKNKINEILNEYRPYFIGQPKISQFCSLQPFKKIGVCEWINEEHISQHHSLIITNNSIKEMCLECNCNHKILYKNINNTSVSIDYLKYILSLYYERIIDLTLMKDFYNLLDSNNDLNKKDIEYKIIKKKYLCNLVRHISPYWKSDKENNSGIGYYTNKSRKLREERKNMNINTLIIQSDLGTGKSYQIEKLCKKYKNHYKRKLIITSRVSYSTSILNRYNESGLDFKYYKNEKDVSKCDNLVIQLESLWKIMANGKVLSFDLIILDECESVFNQFSSSTFLNNMNKLKNIDTFKYLTNNAKQVIFMDAFITKRTIETIRTFRPNDKIKMINNKYRNGGLIFNELKMDEDTNEEVIAKNIYNRLEKGEKIYGFISSIKSIKFIEDWINEKSNGKYKVKTYHGETEKKDKIINDANIEWIKYDVVLTTSTITIGIDFKPSTPYFDCSFFLGNDMSCSIRDCLQALYRVRDLKSKNVYYLLKEKEKSMSLNYNANKKDFNNTFDKSLELMKNNKSLEELNDIVSENNDRKWILDILSWNILEANMNKSFYKECFKYFCMIQNYKIIECKEDNKKSEPVASDKTPNSMIKLLTDDEAYELQELGEERTNEQDIELMKYRYYKNGGVCDSDWLWKRYLTNKNGFYMDKLLNNNHSISDMDKLIIPDITSKILNKQKINVKIAKKLLKIINKDNLDIYTNDITFKGKEVIELCKEEKLTFKTLSKIFNGSLFKIGQHKRVRKGRGTDINETTYKLHNTIIYECKNDMIEYVVSKERREDNNYEESHTIRGDVNSVDTLNQYVSEVIDNMKSYIQQPKEQMKLEKCMIK